MTPTSSRLVIALLMSATFTAVACSDPVAPPDGDADADADADGDTNADADANADADRDVSCDPGDGPRILAISDSVTAEVDDLGEVRIMRGGDEALRLPLDAFEIGTVSRFDPMANYDPYYLEDVESDIYVPPPGLDWQVPSCIGATVDDGALALTLDYPDGRRGRVIMQASTDRRLAVRWTPPAGAPPAVFLRLRLRAPADEHYYGLGEVFDHVDHRGAVRAMQIEPAALEGASNEAHVPIPLLIGTGGWGLYVDSRRPGVFAPAVEEDDLVRVTYGLGDAAAEGLAFHLIVEDHPLDVTRHYYELTGFPGPVAPWALGPWIWRDEVAGQAAVEDDLQLIRDLDLATTGYWIDRPYASAVNSFDFAPADYADPAAMMAFATDLGYRLALWHTPYVDEDDEDSLPLYEHALAEGYFPPVAGSAMARWGPPIDFTNPDALAWWQGLLGCYRDLGVVGYKLDYAEEVIIGAFGVRLPWEFHDGSNELTMHRGYQEGYHRAYAEMLPDDGGFLLCRAAVAGDQVNGTIIWPGDIDATMTRFGEPFIGRDGEEHVGVGGLPSAVVASSSLGPSGFPLFGSDTGGYRHSPPDRETYIRWFEHTALSTVMQVGTNTNDLPWDLGDLGRDEEVLELYGRYARLHLRLFPYLWSAWSALLTDGRALQRPLGLAHPELGTHPDDVYLLGDDLLVAPVVESGVVERELVLPAGGWQEWWSGTRYEGAVTVPAPLDTIPLLVRDLAPIPMLRPTIDTLLPVADPDAIDSFATTADPLWVRVAVRSDGEGEARSTTMYDGTVLTVTPPLDADECPAVQVGIERGEVFRGAMVFELVGGVIRAASWSRHDAETSIADVDDMTAFEAADAAILQVLENRALVKVPRSADGLTAQVCSP